VSTGVEIERKEGLTIPRNVLILGAVSFFNDVSTEMTLTILPLFLRNVLGVGTAVIGFIEGFAETTASLSRMLFGWLSDRTGKRKAFALAGYALSSLTKPVLYFAGAWSTVFGVRFADRLGKGVRTAARDALIADSTPQEKRGLSFGFHRAADTGGAFVGLSLVALLVWLGQKGTLKLEAAVYRNVVLAGMVPGFLAVLLLLLVREIAAARRVERRVHTPLNPRFKWLVAVMALFTLSNSSDAFLMLRSQNVGLSVLEISVILVAFNAIYTVVAMPMGAWSDRVGRPRVIRLGWFVYAAVYLIFAVATRPWQIAAAWLVYAIYYAMVEAMGRALVADFVPSEQRATAYGIYGTAVAITALPASLIAGALWQGIGSWNGFGPSAPFYFGSATALLAAVLLTAFSPRPASISS
jgi:MFS family permease